MLVSVLERGVSSVSKKFKLNKNSVIVKSWVIMIQTGSYTFNEVPDIFNLRQLVADILGIEEVEEVVE